MERDEGGTFAGDGAGEPVADTPEDLAEGAISPERAAEAGVPVPAIHARGFARDPAAAAVMDSVDPATRGRRIVGVLELLIPDDAEQRGA